MLREEDLAPVDEELLNLLQNVRITAPFASDETRYSSQYIRDRLGRLIEHGNVNKIYEGLYELSCDPRNN